MSSTKTSSGRQIIFYTLLAIFSIMVFWGCKSPLFGLGGQVDIDSPTLTITGIMTPSDSVARAISNPEYVRGSFILSGTCADDILMSSVDVLIQDQGTEKAFKATLDTAGTGWTVTIETAGFADGEKTIVVRATDATQKSGETRTLVYVDNNAPLVMISSPASPTSGYNGNVIIAGTAFDPFSVTAVNVYLFADNGGELGTLVAAATATGTAEWTYNLDSSALAGGNYHIVARAIDRAGNINTYFYFYNTIREANGGKFISIDQVARVGGGIAVPEVSITQAQVEAARILKQPLVLDPDTDKPTFELTTPGSNGIIGLNATAVGMVMDDDGVDPATIFIRVVRADGTVTRDWIHDSVNVGPQGLAVRWTYLLPISEGGQYTLYVKAKDIYGLESEATPVAFTVDAGVPSVTFDALPLIYDPAKFYYSSANTLSLTGTALVSGATISTVKLYVNGDSKANGTVTGSTWSASLPLTGLSGKITLQAQATDSLGRVGTTMLTLIVDAVDPSASFITPGAFSTIYGDIILRGLSSDNNSVQKLEIKLGLAGTGIDEGYETITENTYNWTKTFTASSYALAAQSDQLSGDGTMTGSTWKMPVSIRVTDISGRVTTTGAADYYLVIDLDRDRPTVAVQSPPDNQNVGGPILIAGIAYDESPGLDCVKMRILAVQDDGATAIGYVNPDGTAASGDGWFTLTGKTAWTQEINANGKMYNVGKAAGAYPAIDDGLHKGNYKIYIKSIDQNGKESNESLLRIRLDETIPRIESLKIDGADYVVGSTVKKTVTLSCSILDDEQVKSIKMSWDGGQNYSDELITGAAAPYTVTKLEVNSYTLSVSMDTESGATIPSAITTNKNGTLYLNLRIIDNANYQTVQSIRLNVDNIYPTSTYAGAAQVSGTEYRVSGIASDTGTVQGISHTIVYLMRSGNIYAVKPAETLTSTILGSAASLVVKNMANGGAIESVPYPGSDNKYFVKIDTAEDLINGNKDLDGYKENFSDSAAGRTWEAYIKSTLIPDGSVELHYVVFDLANNATHYIQTLPVKNHPPAINSVVIGTDLNGNGTSDDDLEERPAAYSFGALTDMTKTFTVRNNRLFITIGQSEASPNTPLTYSAKIGAQELIALTSAASTSGQGYASFTADSIADGTAVPVVLRVTDSLGYYDERTVRINLDNVDGTAPLIAVGDIGKLYTSGATWVARTIGGVTSYDDNVQWTDANANAVRESTELREGHVEYAADSQYDNVSLTERDADVSGIIKIRGKLWDDQKIARVTVSFNKAFDLDGTGAGTATAADTEIDLAAYAASALSPVAARSAAVNHASNTLGFSVDSKNSPEQSNENGHVVNFTMTWNTAFVTNVAGADVIATFKVYDAATGVATTTIQMDVVPYIQGIATPKRTSGGLKDVNIRSSSGKYSIIAGSDATFLTVTGFNLNLNAARIVAAAAVSGTVTAATGTALAYTGVAAPYTSVNLSNASGISGYIELFANDVRTLNNINGNDAKGDYTGSDISKMYNREPDLYEMKNITLNDDRYLRFFSMKDTGVKNAYYPEMVLEGDNPVFGYVNLTGGLNTAVGTAAGTGAGNYYASHAMPQRAKFDGSSGAEIYKEYLIKASIWDQMGMAKDDGNRYIHASVYNRDACGMSILYDRYAELYTDGQGWGTGTNYSGYAGNKSESVNNNAISIEQTDFGNGLLLGRFQYPKMIAKGNSRTGDARIYMMYYDDNTTNRDLIFRNFRVGTTAALGNQLFAGSTSSTGEAYAQYTNLPDSNTSGRLVSASAASKHFDFAVTSDYRVIVIYYDETAGRLKLRYTDAAVDASTPLAAVTWTDSAITFPNYIGNYVSMTLDSVNGIHIAAYDAGNSDLAYMYISAYDSSTLNKVTVDAAFAVGNWTKIKVREPGTAGNPIIPYIAYYNSSETGGRDAIKLAYCLSGIATGNIPAGVDATTGYTTGNWEYMNVPAITPPQGGSLSFKQVNLDFDTSGKPIVGYLGTNLEFGSWLSE